MDKNKIVRIKPMEDFVYHRARKELVNLLREKGITDEKVLIAISEIPRHKFIPDTALHKYAYQNKAFPIGSNQTISHPFTVAFQSQLLEIKKGDKILEIGTGSGYQAAVIDSLGAKLFTIERQKSLFDRTTPFLQKLGYDKIKFYYGDGFLGKPIFAPYDKIIITAAAPEIPSALLEQLKTGGFLIIPLDNEQGKQDMLKITKTLNKDTNKYVFITEKYQQFEFVPMLKGKNV